MGHFLDKITPWNTADERSQKEEDKRKTMELAAELELKKNEAGLINDNQLSAMNSADSTKTYIILGVVLVFVVGISVYFKFRKK